MEEEKIKTARLSIVSNTLLVLMKTLVGLVTGSVSIVSEAIHSGMDLLASVIAYFSVKISSNPADEEHPYGHGKVENISGVIEAILIFMAAGFIIFESVLKFFHPHEIESIGWGSLVMLISAGVNFFVSRKLYAVAKETDSIALEADALHLKTDVYTSLGVAVGLGFIYITGWQLLDPIVAIAVALLIIKESIVLLKNAYSPLLDASLSEVETTMIKNTMLEKAIKFHNLRTRKSGHMRFADVHIELPPTIDLKTAHDLCDQIENEIRLKIKHIEIHIHMEPSDDSQPTQH